MSEVAAKFKVSGSSTLESLDLFILIGDVESGKVEPGMDLIVPVSSRAERPIPILSVEAGIPVGGIGGTALTFAAADWARLAGLGFKALSTGPVLEVRSSAA